MGQGSRSEWVVKRGERLRLGYGAVLHDNREFDAAAAWAAMQREEFDSGKK